MPIAIACLVLCISKASLWSAVKLAPFECGFEELHKSRLRFSLKYFLIVLIFLVFDVEVALVLPTPLGVGIAEVGLVGSRVLF